MKLLKVVPEEQEETQETVEDSVRARGAWALLFSLCAIASLFGSDPIAVGTVYFNCAWIWWLVWMFACEKRMSKGYWPAGFANRQYFIHFVLMVCVAGILLGTAFQSEPSLRGAFLGLGFVMLLLSWDLLIHDTESKYVQKLTRSGDASEAGVELVQVTTDSKGITTQKVGVIIGIVSLLLFLIAQFDEITGQLVEWWSLFK